MKVKAYKVKEHKPSVLFEELVQYVAKNGVQKSIKPVFKTDEPENTYTSQTFHAISDVKASVRLHESSLHYTQNKIRNVYGQSE